MLEPCPAAHNDDAALHDWLTLALTDGIGPVRGAALVAAFGSPAAVLAAPVAALAGHVGHPLATRLATRQSTCTSQTNQARRQVVESALAWRSTTPDAHLLTPLDPHYPERLRHLADPPLILYVHGQLDALTQPQVAIVGSRHASAAGLDTARGLAASLAARGFVITSGLAEGIDAAAHAGALAAPGRTVAVLGTGIDQIYPSHHQALARHIPSQGALVSELPPGSPARPGHFPRRNRLIAALAQAVLVVEAALRSGSLITARCAAELGREVLAVPGSIHSPRARGCHQLLRDGAGLVETVDDVLAALGSGYPASSRSPDSAIGSIKSVRTLFDKSPADLPLFSQPSEQTGLTGHPAEAGPNRPGSPLASRLLGLLSADPVHPDRLAVHLERPIHEVLALAITLEIEGQIQRLPDGRLSTIRP